MRPQQQALDESVVLLHLKPALAPPQSPSFPVLGPPESVTVSIIVENNDEFRRNCLAHQS